LLGALIQGGNVTETVGSGLVLSQISVLQASSILLISSSLVIVSVLTDYPMPTAFTVIGTVVGTGIGFSQEVVWKKFAEIAGYWILVPFLSVPLGYGMAWLLREYVSKEDSRRELEFLLLLSGSYVAYSAGASAVGLAVGPLSGLDFETSNLLLLGAFSILAGTWIYSPRIINAISFDYSDLGPRRSIAALATSGLLAQIGVFFGIPISFNEAVIASLIGSGLVSGDSGMQSGKILRTVLAWLGAFLVSILLGFGAGLLLS
jgi:PiT family inorganic phosphate transporter